MYNYRVEPTRTFKKDAKEDLQNLTKRMLANYNRYLLDKLKTTTNDILNIKKEFSKDPNKNMLVKNASNELERIKIYLKRIAKQLRKNKPSEVRKRLKIRKHAIKSSDFDTSSYPIPAKKRFEALNKIVTEKQMGKVDGKTIDMLTAHTVISILKRVSIDNQRKLLSLPINKMIDVVYKVSSK